MDSLTTNSTADHQRWLIENGLFTDLAKDNIYLYGALLHQGIEALHTMIDVERHVVTYILYVSADLHKKINKFNKLSSSASLFDMWKLRRLLKKEGNLNFGPMINRFIQDFCGPKWRAEVKIDSTNNYVDNLNEQQLAANQGTDRKFDTR